VTPFFSGAIWSVKPRRISEDNIKTVLEDMGMAGVKWTNFAQDRIGTGDRMLDNSRESV
jgi:hypothetical protein